MKVCILGAGGCFGQNLAQYLNRFGYEVMGIGRSEPKEEPYSLGFQYDYRVFHLVTEFERAWDEIETYNPDVIINFAAHAGLVPQSWQYPEPFYLTNTLMPVKIAKRLFCRYIHIGSSEVYGSNSLGVDEGAPIRPSSPYAVSKAAADLHLMTLKDERITVIRPSNCYCPGQSLHRLIPRAVHAAITGIKMPLNGNPSKSYLHAEDLSYAIRVLLDNPKPGIFNVGSAYPIRIKSLVEMVAKQFNKSLLDMAEVKPGRENEDDCFWLDSRKMADLGWRPTVSLERGIEDMVYWGQKYADQIKHMKLDYQFSP